MVSEKIFGNSIGAFVSYGKNGTTLVPLKVNADGELVVNLEAATVNIGDVDVLSSALPTGAATEQGLDDILAKLSADPATQTTLAAILAKIIAAPATEAKQDTGNASLSSIAANLASKDPTTVPGTTTEAYVAALSWSCKNIKQKTIIITNTHATLTMLYKISGYAKSGSTGFDPIQAATTLLASTCDTHTVPDEYDAITVEVIDGTGHATFTIDYLGGQ